MAKKRIRLSAEESQERILTTSIKLFSKSGFADTSFQMIADECKLSQSAIIHHFPTKDKLVSAIILTIVKHNHQQVGALMEVEDNAVQRLEKHFIGNLSWAFRNPEEAQFILLLYYLASVKKDFAKFYAQVLPVARLRIKEHLLAGVREGIFRADLKGDEAAELLHDALLGGIVNLVSTRKVNTTEPNPKAKWDYLIQFYRIQ